MRASGCGTRSLPWPWIGLSVVVSELFTALLNSIQSYARFGYLSLDLLVIGAVDAMFVPLIVAPVVIYFISPTRRDAGGAPPASLVAARSPAADALIHKIITRPAGGRSLFP